MSSARSRPAGGSVGAEQIAAALGPAGRIAQCVDGYTHRPQQQAMAETIADTLDERGILICEAGTGTGKTFAYLVPALLSGLKVLISTGTRNLQDQLFKRDLPLVRDALAHPVAIALLKGRANYLCRYRMDLAEPDRRRGQRLSRSELKRIRDWAAVTRSGDIVEVGLPEDSPVWPAVTSTKDNCLGQDCPEWRRCHLVEARRRAQEADLVVINHHLLCADLALKGEGFGELLPGADCIIVDEAHQLPDVASRFFGDGISGRQLLDLGRDIDLEYRRDAGDMPELVERAARLAEPVGDVRLALGETDHRGPWQAIDRDPTASTALAALKTRLGELREALESIEGRSKGLDLCLERCRLHEDTLTDLICDTDTGSIRWYETLGRGFRLNRTPLSVAEVFQAHMNEVTASWVFTSATLAVDGRFDHFAALLGITDARTACWDSPFDYSQQALWFVPRGLPQPAAPEYNQAVAELAERVVNLSGGRAFLLYTSYRALNEAAAYLEPRLEFPTLVQGTAPRAELVERFRRLGNAVLLGTSSFWEGVDVRGDALSCVIIDKLPFASPGDPVLAARIEATRNEGGNPFNTIQLPHAVIALKQGAGRLIRDAADSGVLVVCDPRLLARSYGYTFLNSMPPMARTRDIDLVERFFAEHPPANPAGCSEPVD